MNQRKPLAERHPELLRIEAMCDQERAARSENNLRALANQEFMRSLSQLEQTLVGDEVEDQPKATMPKTMPIEAASSDLEELADAVADIEAYIQGHSHSDEN
jgi:ATP phosphoribosyltransferase regulatory subunit HisZ